MGHFAQLVFLDLLRRGHRECLYEVYIFRDLEPGDAVFAERLDVMLRNLSTIGADDERGRLFAVLFRRATHDGYIFDARHRAEKILDFLGRDVLSTANDEVFESTGDVVVTLFVHAPDVAGMEPAVFIDAGGSLFGHIVVPDHIVVATAAYFAVCPQRCEVARFRVYDGNFDAGESLSDGLAFTLDGRLEVSGHSHNGTCFGKPVRICDFLHEHLTLGLLHPVNGACRSRHDSGPERTQVESFEKRMVKNCDIHRRYAVCCGAFLLFYRCQHLHWIKLLKKDHCGSVIDATHYAKNAAEAMEEWHGNAYAVAAGEILACSDPEAIVGDAAMGELHAFRETGSAGRILHIDNIVHLALRLTGIIVGKRRFLCERLHFIESVHSALFCFAKEENALEVRIGGAL